MLKSLKAGKPTLHWEILDHRRRRLLPKLRFLRQEYGFYLAGGTALALQIGHRTSVDFDFYSGEEFDHTRVLASFRQQVGECTLIQNPPQTLIVQLGDIGVSVFYYRYPLLKPVVKTQDLCLASKEDIAAMKLIAILQRGNQRDFVDLYFLMKEFTLERIFGWAKKKFPPFNPYLALRALTYFKDAEGDPEKRRFRLLKNVDWAQVKRQIVGEVDRFMKRGLGG